MFDNSLKIVFLHKKQFVVVRNCLQRDKKSNPYDTWKSALWAIRAVCNFCYLHNRYTSMAVGSSNASVLLKVIVKSLAI